MRTPQRQNPQFVAARGQGFRDRPINSRIVPCPSCRVPAGEPCIALVAATTVKVGDPVRTFHRTRRRMAIRHINQEAA